MSFQTTPLTPIHPLTLVSIQFFFLSWPPCCVSQISSHRQISQNTRSSACLESLPLMENKKNAEVLREKKKCWFYFKLRAGLHQTCWNITSLGKAKRGGSWSNLHIITRLFFLTPHCFASASRSWQITKGDHFQVRIQVLFMALFSYVLWCILNHSCEPTHRQNKIWNDFQWLWFSFSSVALLPTFKSKCTRRGGFS